MFPEYDVIVVGAGHAGCEAAAASANLGSKVLLITMNMQTIAQMSCNPAMGGIAKGQIVREIDALGGYSGIVTDESMIQFRMLNRSKGPAMWSPRAQSDRMLFATKWREMLEQTPNVDFYQDMVNELLVKDGRVYGVVSGLGHKITAKSVVLTNGTFLNGIIHIGEKQLGGGRMAEKAATGITEQLVSLGFISDRLKTGTPPRIDGRSLDYSKMEEQCGDEEMVGFSYTDTKKITTAQQKSCWITYTNTEVHEILKTGFEQSPMFQGRIQGTGPRYCPSIEDKINRFAERDRHQLFVEPEGFNTVEIYVNGFSSSLPEEVQYQALKKVPGFENCKMFRPGYAIEYDYFQPTQLKFNLETKLIENLFFAGQINGTTGYEEAACQGLMAGINAHQKATNQEPFILSRSEAYIGVLIDDLITKGTKEPYRMFTSRAEYRILLRQDNADIRLTPIGHAIGLASDDALNRVQKKNAGTEKLKRLLEKEAVLPDVANRILTIKESAPINQQVRLSSLITRPNITMEEIFEMNATVKSEAAILTESHAEIVSQTEIQLKYDGYINREQDVAKKMNRLEEVKIPPTLDYWSLVSLSSEAKEKLTALKPATIGQASRVSGVSPSDVSVLLIFLGR